MSDEIYSTVVIIPFVEDNNLLDMVSQIYQYFAVYLTRSIDEVVSR